MIDAPKCLESLENGLPVMQTKGTGFNGYGAIGHNLRVLPGTVVELTTKHVIREHVTKTKVVEIDFG